MYELENDNITIYVRKGLIQKITPADSHPYDARYIYIYENKRTYDMRNPNDVISMPFYRYDLSDLGNGPLGCIDYVMRMISSRTRARGKIGLSRICLLKTTAMMYQSVTGWTPRDYIRMYEWLIEDYWFDEAEYILNLMISKEMYGDILEMLYHESEKFRQSQIDYCIEYGHDLIKVSDNYFNCSANEFIESDRIYSISGKNLLYPKYKGLPHDCRNAIFPANEDELTPLSIIKSRAPRIDNRTEEMKTEHQKFLDKIKYDEEKLDRKVEYYKLKCIYGDLMPKTFNSYSRIKLNNGKTYHELLKKIDLTRINDYPRNKNRYNEFVKMCNFLFKETD